MLTAPPLLHDALALAFEHDPTAKAVVREDGDGRWTLLSANAALRALLPAADDGDDAGAALGIDLDALATAAADPSAGPCATRLGRDREGPPREVRLRPTLVGSAPATLLIDVLDGPPVDPRVDDVIDSAAAVIYVKDLDGRYLFINRFWEDLYAHRREDVVGRTDFELFPAVTAEQAVANDRRVLREQRVLEFEEIAPDGREDHTFISVKFPLRDEDGVIYALAGISTDITARSRAEASSRAAREQAERDSRTKSEFLSRVSHELRTPLNAILGYGQLLTRGDASDRSADAEQIVRAATHLTSLVDEVIDISGIEAGEQTLELAAVHACEPLRDAIDLVRPLAGQHEIALASDVHGGLLHYVRADARRLRQVLVNLLANAVKYNRAGGRVDAWIEREDDRLVRFLVRDTGRGIAPEDREDAFHPFTRLGAERTPVEGSGLGLTVARTMVTAMGGTLAIVDSALGEGTTFAVELPAAPAAAGAAGSGFVVRRGAAAAHHLGPATVLYVEDHPGNVALMQRVLDGAGTIELRTAASGHEGLTLAREQRPDLILLDLHLPDLHGSEVLRRLAGDPRTAEIPVVVLSADATPATRDDVDRAGSATYLTKPLDIDELLTTLQRSLAPTAAPAR